MIELAGIVLAFATATASAQADGGADEQAVRQALSDWAAAFNAGDGERVCDLFASDLIAVYQGVRDRSFADLCPHFRSVLGTQLVIHQWPSSSRLAPSLVA